MRHPSTGRLLPKCSLALRVWALALPLLWVDRGFGPRAAEAAGWEGRARVRVRRRRSISRGDEEGGGDGGCGV
eukprot:2504255-Prymnesium_polylepis.1